MSKPESTFIASVHRQFGVARPWFEKNHNAYRGGTPDVFYSGGTGDLWVEYKWLARVPLRAVISLDLSALQSDWLINRYNEGRNVAVIAGCKEGGVIFTGGSWVGPTRNILFRGFIKTRVEIAQWITEQVGAQCVTSSRPFKPQPSP